MIDIDGSFGEGGGQILRTALALSVVTGQAFRIRNIRAARRKPDLRRQHLAAVNAATEIAQAKVEGASLASRELMFTPGSAGGGEYQFAVGTSGSATLVLQTILPGLIVAENPSALILEGGTHNPHAPPFDFLQKTFLPIINQMGPSLDANVPVGKLLADQLILPFAIAASRSTPERLPSSFKTLPLSSHAETNIEVVKQFLDIDVQVVSESDRVCIVELLRCC